MGQSIQRGMTKNVTDMPRPGHPAVREDDVQTMNALVLGLGSALPPPLILKI